MKTFLTEIPGYRGELPWLAARTILLVRHGSHAYGLATPTSDLDIKGVAIPPARYFHGFEHRFEQADAHEPDLTVFDIRKFFSLAAQCNPGLLEQLWADDEDYLLLTPLGEELRAHRADFLSLKAKHTFSGYAMAQLKRINTHYRWLKHPPKARPERTSFGLRPDLDSTEDSRAQLGAALAMIEKEIATWDDLAWTDMDPASKIALKEQIGAYLARINVTRDELFVRTGQQLGFDDNMLDVLSREKRFRAAKQEWDSYTNWLATRNPARAALEERFGYDTKHGMHLVRLMRMCRELLLTGKLQVRRPDRDELLAIRGGAWSYDRLVDWAHSEDAALTELARGNKLLPHGPDKKALDALCTRLVESMLSSASG